MQRPKETARTSTCADRLIVSDSGIVRGDANSAAEQLRPSNGAALASGADGADGADGATAKQQKMTNVRKRRT